MKKSFLLILLFLPFLLTGCQTSEKERDLLYKELIEEELIDDDYELIDVMDEYKWSMEWCDSDSYYIYKNDDGDLLAITYSDYHLNNSYDYEYGVVVYNDIKENEDINYIEETECDSYTKYSYEDEKVSSNPKYEIDNENSDDYHFDIDKVKIGFIYRTVVKKVD